MRLPTQTTPCTFFSRPAAHLRQNLPRAGRPHRLRSASTSQQEVKEVPTLYEQFGGAAAVKATVELFYSKVVQDERVNSWFEGVDMRKQRGKMVNFLTCVLTGRRYQRGLNQAHKKLVSQGLADVDFDVIEELMLESLLEMGTSEEHTKALVDAVESTRNGVLGREEDP